jgi:hypothetical protein
LKFQALQSARPISLEANVAPTVDEDTEKPKSRKKMENKLKYVLIVAEEFRIVNCKAEL